MNSCFIEDDIFYKKQYISFQIDFFVILLDSGVEVEMFLICY